MTKEERRIFPTLQALELFFISKGPARWTPARYLWHLIYACGDGGGGGGRDFRAQEFRSTRFLIFISVGCIVAVGGRQRPPSKPKF